MEIDDEDSADEGVKGGADDGKPKRKVRFGDEMGRIGRRRKGAGKLYDEEAKRYNDAEEEDDGPSTKRHRDHREKEKSDLRSSMHSGRELKSIEDAAEDWEHSEDSGEEEYRRRYEEESGIRIEPFNTEMEREEGHFDDAGNYVEDRFKISQRDAWLDEVQDKYAHGLVRQIKKKTQNDEESMEEQIDSVADLKFLHEKLEDGETVANALRRIGAKKDDGNKALFNQLTECADRLLASGYHNVFSDKKQAVYTRLLATGALSIEGGESEKVEEDGRLWEYRIEDEEASKLDPKKMSIKELRAFLDARSVSHAGFVEKEELIAKARQILSRPNTFGPFGTGQMRQWLRQGYFSGNKVLLVRQHRADGSGEEEPFVRSDRVDLADMLA